MYLGNGFTISNHSDLFILGEVVSLTCPQTCDLANHQEEEEEAAEGRTHSEKVNLHETSFYILIEVWQYQMRALPKLVKRKEMLLKYVRKGSCLDNAEVISFWNDKIRIIVHTTRLVLYERRTQKRNC